MQAKKSNLPKGYEEVPCNLCKTYNYQTLYDQMTYWEYEGVFREVKCKGCGLVFLNPRPKLSQITQYYESDNYFGRDISSGHEAIDDTVVRWEAYGPSYKEVFRRFKKKGRILDVGAGTGLYLSLFKEKGWEVDGIEITPDAVMYAKKQYGIKLRQGDVFDFNLKENYYDVISLNGALEHMYHPVETLTKLRQSLKKSGIIIFSIPNVGSLGREIFGRNWFPWQPPRHLYLFSPQTATKALDIAGFSNIIIDHNYYVQNSYILFNSLRYSKSPKFEKKKSGGLKSKASVSKPTKSFKVSMGKLIWNETSKLLAKVEPFMKKGEVILVTAEK